MLVDDSLPDAAERVVELAPIPPQIRLLQGGLQQVLSQTRIAAEYARWATTAQTWRRRKQ